MVVGGVVAGVTQSIAIDKQIEEYQKAAEEVRNAMQRTSGKALMNAQIKNGRDYALNNARQTLGMAASKVKPEGTKQVANNFKQQNFMNDFNNEANRTAMLKQAEYDRATSRAKNLISQADKQYTATVNTGEAINKGVGATANVANDIFGSAKRSNS